ncbi:MAG: holo-ACP synthase [Chitinispirillales bacterium]|jgi:holo-[acyl-carrier protein] synthase|nr:holo-ACP synthase [Chitinispirillales bacterium]
MRPQTQKTQIKGLGIDIVEIARISRMADKYGRQFLQKIYTAAEIDFCLAKALPGVHFAGRWAVKEAFYKALPQNIQPFSSWKSIQVLSGERGKPYVDVCERKLQNALYEACISSIHMSISHERSHCAAVVMLE